MKNIEPIHIEQLISKKDEKGNIICPNTEGPKKCIHDCTNCPHKQECSPKVKNNRTIRLNKELTSIHKEVLENLNSIHGALL